MKDTLLLDLDTWDLLVDSDGNLAKATPPYSTTQDVASACRLFDGELFYNTETGIPYFQDILGHQPPLSLVRAHIENAALTVPGVIKAKCVIRDINARTLTGWILFVDENGDEQKLDF
jgi:hypothetical protein